tara:strand:- start:653 stop:808 length:156 start_codon:yes stop_codon:yes gene_type:complete
MIRRILASLFPPRAFPEPDGALDHHIAEYLARSARRELPDLIRKSEYEVDR